MKLFRICFVVLIFMKVNSSEKLSIHTKRIENLTKGLKKTHNQKLYFNKLNDNMTSLIVVTGPAGTGKTMIACEKAMDYLKTTDKKVIVTRPLVSVEEEELGFLPGNIDKKMSPWVTPLFDYFLEHTTKEKLKSYIHSNKLEVCPLAFMRGRTFNNAFVIADEMQNSSPSQMKMLVTRMGKESRLIITVDLEQSDIKKKNGLKDLLCKLNNLEDEEIVCLNLTGEDISRSSLVKKMIKLYEV